MRFMRLNPFSAVGHTLSDFDRLNCYLSHYLDTDIKVEVKESRSTISYIHISHLCSIANQVIFLRHQRVWRDCRVVLSISTDC